jgi:hypothetical protein
MPEVFGRVILERKSQWLNRLKNYRVEIDGNETGKISNAAAEEYQLPGGNHSITCKVNWCSSNNCDIEVRPGETVYLTVKSGMKYFWPVYAVFFFVLLLKSLFKKSFPEELDWVRWVVMLACALYSLYYLTFGRKQYLIVEEDTKNIFAS